jgi:hypothetical protein
MIDVATACVWGVVLAVFAAGALGVDARPAAAARAPKAKAADADVSQAASPVYKQQPDPEANPWKDKGIASKYAFGAYYTRKNVDEPWNLASRTDEYADVMVKFDNGPDELVFWRGDNYLPYWKTAGGRWSLARLATQSDKEKGDKVNRNTHATVIESSPRRVVIHWRYMTEFPADVGVDNLPDQTKAVDEYFIIAPDRTVVRAVRPGCPDIESWGDASRVKVSKHKLAAGGIEDLQAADAERKAALELMGFRPAPKAPAKAPALIFPDGEKPPLPEAALSWSLDEGKGRQTREAKTKTECGVSGHGAEWRTGVADFALEFDGYTTRIELPAAKAPKLAGALTLEAWVAVAAYPWNYTAIVQQGDVIDDGHGWFLGFDADGKPTVAAMIDGKKCVLTAEDPNVRLQRFRWTHVAGVIDSAAGKMTIYVDGKAAGTADVPKGKPIDLAEAPVVIGQGPKMATAWPVGKTFGKFRYSVEGMIDEVRVFDTALSAQQVAAGCGEVILTDAQRTKPDMPRRVMPAGGAEWKDFGAHFTHLDYHPSWNNLFRMSGQPDIVVSFDRQPGRYVLWHGVGYIPMMVTENGRWYSNEFNETWWEGCCEPMSDKKVVFGQVQVLEQGPARVVLKWRYPESNVGYRVYGQDPQTGWGDWCDWYFTIYPDGTVTKRMRVYMEKMHSHEWQESMAIFGPDQHPEQVVETRPALYVATGGGEVRKYDWISAPPDKVDYKDVILHVVNMKADYDPYTIARFTGGNVYKARGPSPYSVFPAWNHWPVAQIPSDGRFVHYPDRAAHSSLTHVNWADSRGFGDDGTFEEKVLLEGLSNAPAEKLLTLARSFVNPPAIKAAGEGLAAAYDQNQRAYVLTRARGDVSSMKVTIEASEQGPVCNPAIVVENWGADAPAKMKINGQAAGKGMDVRQSVVPRANGVSALVVWMELTATRPVTVEIAR